MSFRYEVSKYYDLGNPGPAFKAASFGFQNAQIEELEGKGSHGFSQPMPERNGQATAISGQPFAHGDDVPTQDCLFPRRRGSEYAGRVDEARRGELGVSPRRRFGAMKEQKPT